MTARVFGLPPGVDFARAFAEGLVARHGAGGPEALARVTVYVNTRRMARRMAEVLSDGGARLLPRLRVLSDLGTDPVAGLPPPLPALARQLELHRLVEALIAAAPDIAPRAAAFDLAASLARLLDEMHGEGVALEAVTGLETGALAGHWQRSVAFLELVGRYLDAAGGAGGRLDPEARQRAAVTETLRAWQARAPKDPVIVAGSTGSRGTTAAFMAGVAGLPAGAVILPGLDTDLPETVWRRLTAPEPLQDHPQHRHAAFAARVGLAPWAIPGWTAATPPNPARNRLISLALRPAPVTDDWRRDGEALGALAPATAGLTLMEADDPRQEALAIALRLRAAVETGQPAALITPDRMLSRRVAAALARWGITPDDSAGEPLRQTAAGRLVRQVAALSGRTLTGAALIALLKHPLVHRGSGRNAHLRRVRELELHLRRDGLPFPDGPMLMAWATRTGGAARIDWANWVMRSCAGHEDAGALPLERRVAGLLETLLALAAGSEPAADGAEAIWSGRDGAEARRALTELATEAHRAGAVDAAGFAALLDGVLGREVREDVRADPRVRIWGTLEARVQGSALAILGGLNDGVWPGLPEPDPWLNRRMRRAAGLLLPERQIGLAAHDFQQAVAAPEVVLSRARRDGEAPTVPSRWLNRLTALLGGLAAGRGPDALQAMRGRGAVWLARAHALDRPAEHVPAAPRPAPCPPVAHRPRRLSVTRIETLIRDPYAIYAREILHLQPLPPLRAEADPRDRGTALHAVMEAVVPKLQSMPLEARVPHLLEVAEAVLAREIPWATARRLWLARLAAVAPRFVAQEAERAIGRKRMHTEVRGELALAGTGFTLTAKADRIDVARNGRLRIYDYKTGAPPTPKEMAAFSIQLLLEALMAERGGFEGLPAAQVAEAVYLGLAHDLPTSAAALDTWPASAVEARIGGVLQRFDDPGQGYGAQRAPQSERFESDYLHLSRAGEWDLSVPPQAMPVGA